MELTATVAAVLPAVTGVSAKGEWKKVTVVVKWMDGQYEQSLALENMRNADSFAALQVGQMCKFQFNVTSREHNGRWYTSATCWKWEPVGGMPQQTAFAPQQPVYTPQQPTYTPQPASQQQAYAQPYNPGQSGFNIPGQQATSIDPPF